MIRRAALVLLLALLAGGAAGWWWGVHVGLERQKPPLPPLELPGPKELLAERWIPVHLILSCGVDLDLSPLQAPFSAPRGGVGLLTTRAREWERTGPDLTFSLHLGLNPARTAPVPKDATEEPERRLNTILSHLIASETDLLLLERGEDRTFLLPSPKGWVEQGSALVLDLKGRLSIGLALEEALPEDGDLAADLRARGARVTFLVARWGSRADIPSRGFDFVLLPSPVRDAAMDSDRHLVLAGDASASKVLMLDVPRSGPAESLKRRRHLDALERRLEELAEENRMSPGADAKRRALEWAWNQVVGDLDDERQTAFYYTRIIPNQGGLADDDPARRLELLHFERDREVYQDRIKERTTPHRTPGHPGYETCAACHQEVHDLWAKTLHGRAFIPLIRLGAHASPACVTCHTTGFDPTGRAGWDEMSELKGHEHVGCTACHLPRDPPPRPAHPWGPTSGSCRACHNSLSDPGFPEELATQRVSCTNMLRGLHEKRREEAADASASATPATTR